jgi:hypothetical protein
VVDENLLEELRFRQRSERSSEVFSPELDTPGQAVVEPDKKAVASLGFYFNDVPIHTTFLD